MRYLYYCNSAYQLVNILNLNWHRKHGNFESINNYDADIVILNAFSGASEIADILIKNATFSNVIIVNKFKNDGILHKVSSLLDIIFPYRYLNKSGDFNKIRIKNRYDYLCIPKVSSLTLSIWLLNKKAKIQLFEEGMGTYYGGQHMCHEYNTHQELYKYLNNGREFSQYEAVYVNDKRLYLGEDKNKIKEIPKYNKNYFIELSNLFSSVLFKDTKKDIYWIGQYMIGVNRKDDLNSIISNCLRDYKDSVIFCPHPRIKLEVDEKIGILESNKAWELSLLNINNIEDKCFVSIYSTAIFSAKLLYDFEPYMILTIKMLKNIDNEHFKTMERIIDIFKTTYRNQDKIMIPETKEELSYCIKKYIKSVT